MPYYMAFEIIPKALGRELREELNYIEKLAVVMALEQGVVIPSRSGFLEALSQSQRNAFCVLLQVNHKPALIAFFKPTSEEAAASRERRTHSSAFGKAIS
jgi:hypothetical protein